MTKITHTNTTVNTGREGPAGRETPGQLPAEGGGRPAVETLESPPAYDMDDPNNQPAYRPPEVEFIEGDHPTENPDGVTNSNVDYTPKSQEEKADALGVEMVETIDLDPNEPYPIGDPIGEDEAFEQLTRMHSPMELVPSDKRIRAQERNLKAGGSMELSQVRRYRKAL